MALFFDYRWFDDQLAAQQKSRADVARLLNLTEGEVDQLFKDQREMSANDVLALAEMLQQPVAEVADRAGVSTPSPKSSTAAEMSSDEKIAALGAEIIRLQNDVQQLRARVQLLELTASQNANSSEG